MKCKICHKNETNSTSGICWKCLNEKHHQKFFGYCPEHGRWESDTGGDCPVCEYNQNEK
jgi:hypothetical protein